MAIDLTQLQAANDALDEKESAIAGDLQSLTDLVEKLQSKVEDESAKIDAATMGAVHSIAVHVNAVVTRLAAGMSGHQPAVPPGSSPAPNQTPVPMVAPVPEQPATDPTAGPNPAPGAGETAQVEEPAPAPKPSTEPAVPLPDPTRPSSDPAESPPTDWVDKPGGQVVTPDPSAPPAPGTAMTDAHGNPAQVGPTNVSQAPAEPGPTP